MFVEIGAGIRTALDVYERRSAILRLFARMRRQIFYGTSHVGVFGAGGTGKTTLGIFIAGNLDTDQRVSDYQETISIEHLSSPGEIPALFSIVPGQERRRLSSWKELYKDLSSGKSLRIINVASWGFHASGIERIKHRVYEKDLSDEEFRVRYFSDSREVELSALNEIVPHVIATPGSIKMITLVTKQDLWWPMREKVCDHYLAKAGRYESMIETIRRGKGETNFSHDVFSCALVEQNLMMADKFLLAPTAAGYDDALRVANLEQAAAAIQQMLL